MESRVWIVWVLATFVVSSPVVDPEDAPAAAEAGNGLLLTTEFDSVDNFLLDVDGFRETVQDEEQCRNSCLTHDSCRSYSWSLRGTKDNPGRTCIWTKKYIGFDPSWEFHTRTYAVDWQGKLSMVGAFHGFPGMRFVEDRFHSEVKNVDFPTCQAKCADDDRCKGFSFNKDEGACLLSDAGLQYYPGFTYNERNQPVPGKLGMFRHYPVQETTAERARRAKHEKSESILALADRKARLKKVAQEEAVEEGEKARAAEIEKAKAEAQQKTDSKKEQKKKRKAREAALKRDSKSALLRGEYAETVHKSEKNVEEAKVKLVKERNAKRTLTEKKLNAKADAMRRQTAEERAENRHKKAYSKLNADMRETQDVQARLQREQEIRILQVEAYKLGRKEREAKSYVSPAVSSLIVHESVLRRELSEAAHELRAGQMKIAAIELSTEKEKAAAQKKLEETRKLHTDAMALAVTQSEKQIEEARLNGVEAGPEMRLENLKAQEAKELESTALVRKMLDQAKSHFMGLQATDATGTTRYCKVMGMHQNNTGSTWFKGPDAHSVQCFTESEVSSEGGSDTPAFRFDVDAVSFDAAPSVAIKVASSKSCVVSGQSFECSQAARMGVQPDQAVTPVYNPDGSFTIKAKTGGADPKPCSFQLSDNRRVECVPNGAKVSFKLVPFTEVTKPHGQTK